jgi:hypothetical protein
MNAVAQYIEDLAATPNRWADPQVSEISPEELRLPSSVSGASSMRSDTRVVVAIDAIEVALRRALQPASSTYRTFACTGWINAQSAIMDAIARLNVQAVYVPDLVATGSSRWDASALIDHRLVDAFVPFDGICVQDTQRFVGQTTLAQITRANEGFASTSYKSSALQSRLGAQLHIATLELDDIIEAASAVKMIDAISREILASATPDLVDDENLEGARCAARQAVSVIKLNKILKKPRVMMSDDGILTLQWRDEKIGAALIFSGDGTVSVALKNAQQLYSESTEDDRDITQLLPASFMQIIIALPR